MAACPKDCARRKRDCSTVMCDHLVDTTTRYDHLCKRLTFLVFCPVCRTETVVETLEYEPDFKPVLASVGEGGAI
jgi:hypothetical protein